MITIRATSLARVIACNGYIKLGGDNLPNLNPSTEDAQEGIAAHYVASATLSGQFTDPIEMVDRKTPNGVIVPPEMAEYVSEYIDGVLNRPYAAIPSRHVETETDWQVTGLVRIVGRADHIAYDRIGDTLYIDDFKYGFRLHEPDANWALISHAIGIIQREGYTPKRIVFTIFQPRPYHINGPVREWPITIEQLGLYQASLVQALTNLTDMLATGEHCRKCAALAICPAARMAGLNSIEATIAAYNDDVPDNVLAFEMFELERAADAIKHRLEALQELAQFRLNNGASLVIGNEAYALDHAYGRLAWNEGVEPSLLRALTGRTDLSVERPITPTQAKKKGIPEAVIASLSERPYRGTKLVRMNARKVGAKLFGKGN